LGGEFMKMQNTQNEPAYKQYIPLKGEPVEHASRHALSEEIDHENRLLLKYHFLRNTRKLKREFQ
jgi:hypothetical protein